MPLCFRQWNFSVQKNRLLNAGKLNNIARFIGTIWSNLKSSQVVNFKRVAIFSRSIKSNQLWKGSLASVFNRQFCYKYFRTSNQQSSVSSFNFAAKPNSNQKKTPKMFKPVRQSRGVSSTQIVNLLISFNLDRSFVARRRSRSRRTRTQGRPKG